MSAQRLGPYRFVSILGRGGASTVVEAVDERSGGSVALKIPRPDRAATPEDREDIEREAARAATLSHPHIVRVYGTVRDRGQVALVLELVRGAPLAALLEGGPLGAAECARVGAQVASALAAIHSATDASGARLGLVHGDVSPQNVLVDRAGHARLTDFGLARRRLVSAVTGSGLVRGTPGYVAPEIIRGRPADPASDQFSLGATLHHALGGAPPFGEGSILDVMRATVESTPPPLAGALGAVILRALSKRPSRRLESVEAMRAELAALADESAAR